MRIEDKTSYIHTAKGEFDSYQNYFYKELVTQWVTCKESLDFIYKEIGLCI